MEARESTRERALVDAVEKSALAFQAMFDTQIRYSISSEQAVKLTFSLSSVLSYR